MRNTYAPKKSFPLCIKALLTWKTPKHLRNTYFPAHLCRAPPSRSLAHFRATGNNGRGRRNMKIKSESRAALAAMLSALGIPGDKQERAFAIMEGGDDYAPADVGRVIRAREVAERLGVSGRPVRLWGRKGLLRPVTGSGSRFFGYTAESVKALIEGRKA